MIALPNCISVPVLQENLLWISAVLYILKLVQQELNSWKVRNFIFMKNECTYPTSLNAVTCITQCMIYWMISIFKRLKNDTLLSINTSAMHPFCMLYKNSWISSRLFCMKLVTALDRSGTMREQSLVRVISSCGVGSVQKSTLPLSAVRLMAD